MPGYKNILFRADSSSTIGTGHIMRDLVLAEQFEDAGIVFATRDLPGNINHKIKEKNYQVEILESDTLEELDALIKRLDIDMIVIDHYGIDYSFEKQLKIQNSKLNIMVLDDTYEKHYCDILLNHNIYAEESRYRGMVPEHCELRCGSRYTLLRDEFRKEKKRKGRESKIQNSEFKILIAMGGADHSNINIDILKALQDLQNIHLDVVTTTANRHLYELKEYVKESSAVTLHINTDKIAKLMSGADLAIVTPSVTLNEIFYMELPFIAVKTAENQGEMYEYLRKNGLPVLDRFNPSRLKKMVEEAVRPLQCELINFSDLSPDEKKMVLQWRNHPDIRKWMFTRDEITLKEHLQYIDSLKKREDRLYFLVKKDDKAVGVIDFTNIDIKNKTAEFGIYAKPGLRGVGNILMELIIGYAFKNLGVSTLVSEVFKENGAAIKLYSRYNFNQTGIKKTDNGYVVHMELKNEDRQI